MVQEDSGVVNVAGGGTTFPIAGRSDLEGRVGFEPTTPGLKGSE
jgi:hypothetical protein